jgi:diguanylate cyclase (GGDEF)-like protein
MVVLRNLFQIRRDLPRLLTRQAPVFVGALALSAATAAGAYGLAGYSYDRHVVEASDALKNLSFVLADHANRSLLAVNQSVSKVADAVQARNPPTIAALETMTDGPEIRAMLDDIVVDNPFLDSVFVIGADGRVDQRSRSGMVSADLIADTSYMSTLKGLRPGGVYLSAPFQSYQFKTWMLNYSRRISGPNGAFLGAVAGIVKLSSFSDLFEKINLQSKGSIAIVSDEGELLSWAPQAEMPFGSSLTGSALYDNFVKPRRDGVARTTGVQDGVERLVSVANSPDFPVAVIIGRGMPDVVAEWTAETRWLACIAALLILALLLGATRLAHKVDQRAERGRQRVLEQMAEQAAVLSNAIDNIVQGLAMFNKRGVMVLYNKRYAEMYGLPKQELLPGVATEELQDRLKRNGQGKAFERGAAQPNGGELHYYHLRDGRVIAHRKIMLPDGGWVSTHEDVTSRRAAEAKIRQLAARDTLTGLFNRFEFDEQLEKRLDESRRYGMKFAVFVIDLDRFKAVNEAHGHPMGDVVLKRAAERIRRFIGPDNVAFRLGADEFAAIQRVEVLPRDAAVLAERLVAALREPFRINGSTIECGASVGVCLLPADADEAATLVRYAGLALQEAKEAGRGRHLFFAPSMHEQAISRVRLGTDLKVALADGQFELVYQPIISFKTRELTAFEALIRWRHPERGLVSPVEFIPYAEENGLIAEISDWALREACRKVAEWPRRIKVAVNISPVQFRAPGLLASIASALAEAGVEGNRLVAEITEGAMIDDAEEALSLLQSIKKLGVAVAMDDFGTGYSSFGYLRKFPFDKLKIDRSFVGALGVDSSAASIVRAAIALSNALGIGSVAEGIETEEQMAFLAEAGCSEAQGYLISKPMSASDADASLARLLKAQETHGPKGAVTTLLHVRGDKARARV